MHRVAYFHANGPITEGSLICHRCHNRKCINPDHLYEGDHTSNNRDTLDRGTRYQPDNSGARNGRSKLSQKQVDEIRASKKTAAALAREYGVSAAQVSRIRNFTSW
jgi:hypothetical protein